MIVNSGIDILIEKYRISGTAIYGKFATKYTKTLGFYDFNYPDSFHDLLRGRLFNSRKVSNKSCQTVLKEKRRFL